MNLTAKGATLHVLIKVAAKHIISNKMGGNYKKRSTKAQAVYLNTFCQKMCAKLELLED